MGIQPAVNLHLQRSVRGKLNIMLMFMSASIHQLTYQVELRLVPGINMLGVILGRNNAFTWVGCRARFMSSLPSTAIP